MSNKKEKQIDDRFKIDSDKFADLSEEEEKEEEENSNNSNSDNNNINDSQSVKEYDLIDDAISENLDEEKNLEEETLENYKEKIRRSGVLYISYIPEGMTVITLKKHLSNYGVNRVY